MCNIMNGLVPVSSLLLIHLFSCRVTSGGACVTGVAAATTSCSALGARLRPDGNPEKEFEPLSLEPTKLRQLFEVQMLSESTTLLDYIPKIQTAILGPSAMLMDTSLELRGGTPIQSITDSGNQSAT